MLFLSFLSLALAVHASPTSSLTSTTTKKCKCLPSDPCWPSKATWAAFQKQLTNPLISNVPLAAPCYNSTSSIHPISIPSNSTSKADTCAEVVAGFGNYQFRAHRPETAQFTVWEQIINTTNVAQCISNPGKTDVCAMGRVPVISVNVSSVADIQASLKFAAQHNIKLTVKNSGHETIGRSLGIGSLSLWTFNFKGMNYTDSFKPVGANKSYVGQKAITVSSGTSWGEAYDFAYQHNVTLVGGIGAGGSVGAGGGWIMGAGHSILSPFHGLGIDNVLQFTVVLPNGTFTTANSFTNPALFRALKGGGGPSFGVLIKTTYKAHPAPPVTAAFFQASWNSTDARAAVLTAWIKAHTNISDGGWGGFYPYNEEQLSLTLLTLGAPPTNSKAKPSLTAFYNTAKSLPGVNVTLATYKAYSGFHQWYDENFIHTELGIGFNYTVGDFGGVPLASGSWLVPREAFDKNVTNLAKAVVALPGARPFIVGGPGVNSVDPALSSTTPAWRSMLLDITFANTWPANTSAPDIETLRQQVTAQTQTFKDLSTTGGSYLNEGNIEQMDWQNAYWGAENYKRLLALKKEVDPNDVLVVVKGVNSEAWDQEILCKTV